MQRRRIVYMRIFFGWVCICLFPACIYGVDMNSPLPLSVWDKKDAKGLSAAFWSIQQQTERSWPVYINESERQFAQVYGNGIKNSYDLFLKEGAPGNNTHPQVKERKTLKRLIDLACIPGKMLGDLKGSPITRLRVIAFRENALRVIPADILEFSPGGRMVLPLGPEGNPRDGDGLLGDADKLFFMAMDAGARVDKRYLAESFKGLKGLREIEISYAPDHERGWVYVAAFSETPPAKAPFDYIKIFPEASIIYTPFVLVQAKPRPNGTSATPTADVCTWAIAPSLGGVPQDIHNKFHVNMKLSYRMGVATNEDQETFNLRFRAWYDGDVVVYGRCAWKVKTPLGIGAPTIFADIVGTAFTALNQNFLATTFDPSLIIKSFNLTIGDDLNNRALNSENKPAYRLITPEDRQGWPIDGRMSAAESASAAKQGLKKDRWHVLTGPWGSLCIFAGLNDYLARHATRFDLDWKDTPTEIGSYRYNLDVNDFKNRQEWMYLEWNAVPFFTKGGQYDWKNLDLALKHREKPLTYSVEGASRLTSPAFLNIPDIKQEKGFYKY